MLTGSGRTEEAKRVKRRATGKKGTPSLGWMSDQEKKGERGGPEGSSYVRDDEVGDRVGMS